MAESSSGRPIVVIGSINMDLVCRTERIPLPGQTILGSDVVTIPGGKGANQAVAVAKLGHEVHMVGRVGDDDFGQRLLNGLGQHRVGTDCVTVTEGTPSGCAVILVDRKGENTIVVAPGANAKVTPGDVDAAEGVIRSAAVVVMQLEIPYETVQHAIGLCRRHGVYTILDPAPSPRARLPRAMYGVDVFTPNQSEAEMLVGLERTHGVKKKRVADPKQIGSDLIGRGARTVVLKLGGKGAMIVQGTGQIERVRPFKVKVVDTTAAGDAFTAGLAVAHAEGKSLREAVRFANAAGAVCCRTFGAQPALPGRGEVEELLGEARRR